MVSKSSPNLQRRHRGGAPRDRAPSDFFHVPAKPRQYRNSAPYLEPNGKCTRSCGLNRPKTSLGVTILAGCASRGWMQEGTDGFVGQPLNAAIAKLGAPSEERMIADTRVYLWTSGAE